MSVEGTGIPADYEINHIIRWLLVVMMAVDSLLEAESLSTYALAFAISAREAGLFGCGGKITPAALAGGAKAAIELEKRKKRKNLYICATQARGRVPAVSITSL